MGDGQPALSELAGQQPPTAGATAASLNCGCCYDMELIGVGFWLYSHGEMAQHGLVGFWGSVQVLWLRQNTCASPRVQQPPSIVQQPGIARAVQVCALDLEADGYRRPRRPSRKRGTGSARSRLRSRKKLPMKQPGQQPQQKLLLKLLKL